jgi:hypothetical protein
MRNVTHNQKEKSVKRNRHTKKSRKRLKITMIDMLKNLAGLLNLALLKFGAE